jgi:hypothetical protein
MTFLTRASLAVLTGMALLLPACGGGGGSSSGGGGSNPTATPIPSSTATASPNSFICPSSDGTSQYYSVARASGQEATKHAIVRAPKITSTSISRIAVTYERSALQRSASNFARTESSVGSTLARSFDYPALGKTLHILTINPSTALAAMTTLRAQSGVISVAPTGQRRYRLGAAQMQVSNNYFPGFSPNNPTPFYEEAASPGQWDMHAIRVDYAFGYSQAGNGTGSAHPAALGTHAVKLAVIDTGQDTLNPSLGPNIIYQKCFITNEAGTSQSSSIFTTDPQGHGTDVTGIAGAVTNPSGSNPTDLGFAGAGGNVGILAYRVFPTPDDSCENPNSNDPACGADTADIASAINDAIAQGASVISMSLGGNSCTTAGVDTDPTEGAAVANAIAAHVVVVAAAGNESTSAGSKQQVDAPACDAEVIAVGATSLDDGTANGTSAGGGNAHPAGNSTNPQEYVAYYSNAGTPGATAGANVNSPTAWGIVAPGGDPANAEVTGTADDLHWIENIWTSTPFMANSQDITFAGECTDDFPNSTATTAPVDCRTLIAGTSQATPHVAGVAALICGLNIADCTPTAMKALLCTYADDITDANEGCGRLDAYRAVAIALTDGDPGTFTR